MLKTTIVVCCDKCETIIKDNDSCYGFLSNEGNEYYLCKDCIDKIVEEYANAILDTTDNFGVTYRREMVSIPFIPEVYIQVQKSEMQDTQFNGYLITLTMPGYSHYAISYFVHENTNRNSIKNRILESTRNLINMNFSYAKLDSLRSTFKSIKNSMPSGEQYSINVDQSSKKYRDRLTILYGGQSPDAATGGRGGNGELGIMYYAEGGGSEWPKHDD